MKHFLVSTALEETWESEAPLLFLGKWCLNPSQKYNWKNIDFNILAYHWDDMNKLKSDEIFLENIYEKILEELVDILNSLHSLDWDKRSWSIIIGVWLRRYITILYDRYTLVHDALEKYDIEAVYCGTTDSCQLTPLDRNMFSESYKSDRWNYYLFSRIIRDTTDITVLDKDIEAVTDNASSENPSVKPFSKFKALKMV